MKSATLALDFGGEETALLDAPKLLATLRGRGVLVASDGEKLLLDAPRGALTDLLPDLQKFKPALLELLAGADARPQPKAQPLDENRNRLNRLESLLSSEGAAAAVVMAARHIEARNPDFWRQLRRELRHELAVCAALLDNDLHPDETQTEGEEAR